MACFEQAGLLACPLREAAEKARTAARAAAALEGGWPIDILAYVVE
jgi:hypothetical protein